MDYEVTLSLSARRDLEDVVLYISADAPERAIEFGRFLISNVKSLGQFPEMGRVVPEFGNPIIRKIVVRFRHGKWGCLIFMSNKSFNTDWPCPAILILTC